MCAVNFAELDGRPNIDQIDLLFLSDLGEFIAADVFDFSCLCHWNSPVGEGQGRLTRSLLTPRQGQTGQLARANANLP